VTDLDPSAAPATRAHRRHVRTRRRLAITSTTIAALAAAAVAALVITDDGQPRRYLSPADAALSTPPQPGGPTTIAVLQTSIVDIHRRPDSDADLLTRLAALTPTGTPRALPVSDRRGGWIELTLEDGQSGWARTRDVTLETMRDLIRIDLAARNVELFRRGRSILRITVTGASGFSDAAGTYYIADIEGQSQLLANGNPNATPPDIGQPQLILVADTVPQINEGSIIVALTPDDLSSIIENARPGTPVIVSR
jgi:hypothetical protein